MVFEVAIADPAVQSSIISAIGGIVAAAIAAIAAAVLGKQIAGRKKHGSEIKKPRKSSPALPVYSSGSPITQVRDQSRRRIEVRAQKRYMVSVMMVSPAFFNASPSTLKNFPLWAKVWLGAASAVMWSPGKPS